MSANEPLTIGMITREAMLILENNCKMSRTINREYDGEFAQHGAKIGDTLNMRKPSRSMGGDGQEINIEAFVETSVPLVLNHQFNDAGSFSGKELALSIDDFNKRVLAPKVATVANKVDRLCTEQYIDVANYVGTPGSIPNTLLTYLNAGAVMDEECVPLDDQRYMMMTPRMQVNIVDALKGLFQSSEAIAKQYRSGRMGTAAGFDWFMDQNVVAHTVGILGGTPLVNGANQTGDSLITDAWTSAAVTRLKRGDVITAALTDAVNPQNREDTGSLRNFLVRADTASDGSGNMTIPIYPNIITSGAFQTVTNSPADNAPVLIFGSASAYLSVRTPAGMAYHRDFMTLGVADLPLHGGADKASRVSSKKLQMSIRMISDYTIMNDQFPYRLDILCGAKVKYAEFACRVQS